METMEGRREGREDVVVFIDCGSFDDSLCFQVSGFVPT